MFKKLKEYLIDKLELGILLDKNNKPIAHRSLLKILVNPFLRKFFGIQIASVLDEKNIKFKKYKIISTNIQCGEGRKFKIYLKSNGSTYTKIIRDRCFI